MSVLYSAQHAQALSALPDFLALTLPICAFFGLAAAVADYTDPRRILPGGAR